MKHHRVESYVPVLAYHVAATMYGYSANLAAVLHNANTWMNELMPCLTNIRAVMMPSVSSSKSNKMTNRTIT